MDDGAGAGGGAGGGGGACWLCCWYCTSSIRAFWSSSICCCSAWCRAWAFPAMYAPPPTAAARSNGRLRLIITASSFSPYLHAVGQGEAQREHELGRSRNHLRPADLRGDRDQHA